MLTRAIAQLGLTEAPAAVASRVTASAETTSPVVTIAVTADSGQAAADLANAVAQSLSAEVNGEDVPPTSAEVTAIRADPLALASAPTSPSSPSLDVYMGLGLILGLLLGTIVAYLAAKADRQIRSRAEAEETLRLPVLGVVSRDLASRAGIAGRAELASVAVTEAHRAVRTSLAFVSRETDKKVWVGTGPVNGDAAVRTTAAIAKSFLELGARVLLIDLTSASRSTSAAGGLDGLLEGGAITPSPTGVAGLDLLAGGAATASNASRVLGGRDFAALLGELRAEYDQIFIVAPPLAHSASAGMASVAADGVILVSRLGATTPDQLREAVDGLANLEPSIFAVIVRR